MASIYQLKPKFQGLLRPLTRWLAGAGLTANQVTTFAGVLSIGVGATIVFNHAERWALLLLPGALLVRMALNAIDGMLAREHDQKSRLGAMLNELGDVISDAALYLPLAIVPGIPVWGVVAFVLGAWASEFTGVLAQSIGATRRYDGPMGKSDRAAVVGAMGLAMGLGAPPDPWAAWVVWSLTGLAWFTVLNRLRRGLVETRTIEARPTGNAS